MATCTFLAQQSWQAKVQSIGSCTAVSEGFDSSAFNCGASRKLTHHCRRWRTPGFGTLHQRHQTESHRIQAGRRAGVRAETEIEKTAEASSETGKADEQKQAVDSLKGVALDKEVSKVVRKTAATFAPRASTKSKNPATKGTVLYTVFEVQAWVSIVAGFLLSFNLIFPSDQPDIARLLGMWSVWMLAVPSLRARDCSAQEKEALNYLFVLIPFINVLIPVFWKSFAGVFTADCIAMVGMYAWKMEWLGKGDASET